MPQELNSDFTEADVRGLCTELAKKVNVIVIVPSNTAAETWKEDADQVLVGDGVADGN